MKTEILAEVKHEIVDRKHEDGCFFARDESGNVLSFSTKRVHLKDRKKIKAGNTFIEKEKLKQDFVSASIDDAETLATMGSFFKKTGYILDPHTAIGVAVAEKFRDPAYPIVSLATAHPAKFGDTVKQATGLEPTLPAAFQGLETREKKFVTLSADKKVIKDYISANSI